MTDAVKMGRTASAFSRGARWSNRPEKALYRQQAFGSLLRQIDIFGEGDVLEQANYPRREIEPLAFVGQATAHLGHPLAAVSHSQDIGSNRAA